ncbi:DUF4163 domain-containing protein [Kovacikia minuta CCNUW1]|uniref:PdaC/SigV domain-containing protein n=1 Tax=Kovacikia minuta TaxID=2931930 RepID=UPI001CC8F904|nr:DUF4163 domain-containing protein [Kovacikia minuta]UBF25771.1 DUF4163 domain-containing protein [Kovacikia minuta CCNUW1]
MRNPKVAMHLPKICLLLTHLLLASCTASSSPQISPVPTPASPSPTTSVEAKPPEPVTWIDRIKLTGVVDLNGIEAALIAKKAKLNIYDKTQFSQDCKLTMKYPQISGLADVALQSQLNQILRQEMMRKMGASEPMSEADRCRKVPRKPGSFYTRTTECVVHFAEETLVSISSSNATLPGAYPAHKENSVTFDLSTGKIYQLADLFKSDVNSPIRLAVAMRDSLWEAGGPNYIDFPFERLETQPAFDYYLQESCNEAFYGRSESSLLGDFPKVCMVITNLGSGASRNYRMVVRLGSMKDMLNTSGALQVLAEQID